MLFPWPVLISISIFSRIVNKRSRLRLTREFLVCDWNEVDVRGFGYENASRRARESNNGTVIGSEYTVTLTSSRCKRVAIVNGFRPRSDCQQAESPHRTLPFFRTFFAPSSAHDASTDDDDGQSASSCLAKITPSLSLSLTYSSPFLSTLTILYENMNRIQSVPVGRFTALDWNTKKLDISWLLYNRFFSLSLQIV